MSFERSKPKQANLGASRDLDLVSRVSEALSLLAEDRPSDQSHDNAPSHRAASLALAAAMEAERRLREQENRIAALESLAASDPLTGLLNRRGFEDVLTRALAAARRYGETGIVLLIDLDEFKQVNDTHGHTAGDAVLRRVAELLDRSVRSSDSVARLGGDEFAVLMSRLPDGDGRRRARALERRLNRLTIEYDDGLIPVYASLGVVAFDGTEDALSLLKQADSAMYDRKRTKPGSRDVGKSSPPLDLARTFPSLEVVASSNPFDRSEPALHWSRAKAARRQQIGAARP